MKILIIVDCCLPSTKSSAKLIGDLADEFCRRGHSVTIAAPDQTLSESVSIETENNLTVIRVKSGAIKDASKAVRLINEMRLSSTIWKAAGKFFKANRHDLIVFYSPSIFFGPLVRRLKKLWRCPSYLILRDIFPQWTVDAGILKPGPVCSFLRAVEKHQYAAADVVAVQSPANLSYFEDKKKTVRQLEVLYNWTKLEEDNVDCQNDRERLGLQNKTVFFYGGNIGVAQAMGNVVNLVEDLRSRKDVHFLLVGSGSEVERLDFEIKNRELDNVTIHASVEQNHYLGMLSEFDIGIICLDPNLGTHNLPGKMLGYMYHSMPILAAVNPENDLKGLLEKSHAGLVTIAGEREKLLTNALKLINDPGLRRKMGQNARALLEEKFSVNQAASQILKRFSDKQ